MLSEGVFVTNSSGDFPSLRKAATLFGCAIFLASAYFPFYGEFTFPRGTEYPFILEWTLDYYWSFKRSSWVHPHFGRPPMTVYTLEWWINEEAYSVYKPGMSQVSSLIFAIQVLTMAIAVASLFFDNFLSILPAITCSIIIGLMTFAGTLPSKIDTYAISYQTGYVLSYGALGAFLFAYVLYWRGKRPRNPQVT